jgi:hypothetical protein
VSALTSTATARATVFGLDVCSEEGVAVLAGAQAAATGRCVQLLVDPAGEVRWPPGASPLGEVRRSDGSLLFGVEAHADAGWLLHGEGLGSHLLSCDAGRLRCIPGVPAARSWERFLIAQVLPFAAAVHGLELLHASAVAIDSGALAVLGPAGAGKTSLALALCGLGAEFMADDVLAVELCDGELLAHPGTPRAVRKGRTTERMALLGGARGPAPLRDVLLLDRRPDGPPRPCFEHVGDGATLLSGTFNLMLRDGARATRLLEVCALAARGRVLRVRCGPDSGPQALAAAVLERLSQKR